MSEGMAAPSAAPAESADTGSGDVSRETSEENDEVTEKSDSKPKPKVPKMRKVKVDGKEEFVDEDEVWKNFQKYRAGEKRLQEAANMRRETEEKLSKLKEDPYSVLSELGLNPSELSENWLRKQLEEDFDSDPRDKEMRELQKRLAEYEGKEKKAKETEELSAREKFVESRKEALSKTLAEAMESTVLAKHPETQAALLREMALYMRTAKEQGEDVDASELAQFIETNRFKQYHSLANQFDGDQLIEFLGKDVLKKIRKADLERLRGKRSTPTQSWKTEMPQGDAKKSKFVNPNDVRFAIRNME